VSLISRERDRGKGGEEQFLPFFVTGEGQPLGFSEETLAK